MADIDRIQIMASTEHAKREVFFFGHLTRNLIVPLAPEPYQTFFNRLNDVGDFDVLLPVEHSERPRSEAELLPLMKEVHRKYWEGHP